MDNSKTPTELFESERNDFNEVVDFSLGVSVAARGLPTVERLEYASMVHTKMCVTGASIIPMLSREMTDHSAVAALCRMLMEAMPFYFYLAEEVEEEEWKARLLCLKIHDTTNRIKLMRAFEPKEAYQDLRDGRDELLNELKSSVFFKKLEEDKQKRLLTGDHFYHRGMNTAAEAAGWDTKQFMALYSYFSSHAHSSPMSFFRMRQHKVSFGDPSDAQKALMTTALCVAEYSLLKVTMHHLGGSPDARPKLDQAQIEKFEKALVDWRKSYEAPRSI